MEKIFSFKDIYYGDIFKYIKIRNYLGIIVKKIGWVYLSVYYKVIKNVVGID